ncbi:hypothetical protein GCM10028792_00020 [Salinisphaera aquimarina]
MICASQANGADKIDRVKNSYFWGSPEFLIGQSLENRSVCASTHWALVRDAKDRELVRYTCDMRGVSSYANGYLARKIAFIEKTPNHRYTSEFDLKRQNHHLRSLEQSLRSLKAEARQNYKGVNTFEYGNQTIGELRSVIESEKNEVAKLQPAIAGNAQAFLDQQAYKGVEMASSWAWSPLEDRLEENQNSLREVSDTVNGYITDAKERYTRPKGFKYDPTVYSIRNDEAAQKKALSNLDRIALMDTSQFFEERAYLDALLLKRDVPKLEWQRSLYENAEELRHSLKKELQTNFDELGDKVMRVKQEIPKKEAAITDAIAFQKRQYVQTRHEVDQTKARIAGLEELIPRQEAQNASANAQDIQKLKGTDPESSAVETYDFVVRDDMVVLDGGSLQLKSEVLGDATRTYSRQQIARSFKFMNQNRGWGYPKYVDAMGLFMFGYKD